MCLPSPNLSQMGDRDVNPPSVRIESAGIWWDPSKICPDTRSSLPKMQIDMSRDDVEQRRATYNSARISLNAVAIWYTFEIVSKSISTTYRQITFHVQRIISLLEIWNSGPDRTLRGRHPQRVSVEKSGSLRRARVEIVVRPQIH